MKITDKYVFFWGEIFSQWFPCNMTIDGIPYTSAEQYMMHQKAVYFKDNETAMKILMTDDPREQKSLGRKVRNFDESLWRIISFSIVYRGNYEKFTQNDYLKKELLSTGDRILVEASPYDTIWGIGLQENSPDNEDPKNWRGANLLGQAITIVKQEIS